MLKTPTRLFSLSGAPANNNCPPAGMNFKGGAKSYTVLCIITEFLELFSDDVYFTSLVSQSDSVSSASEEAEKIRSRRRKLENHLPFMTKEIVKAPSFHFRGTRVHIAKLVMLPTGPIL